MFADGAAPRSKTIMMMNRNNQSEFTITHNSGDKVDKPWGFRRQTTIMNAEAQLSSEAGGPTNDPNGFVPDMERRVLMNYLLLASLAGPVGIMGGAFIMFFIPRTSSGSGGAQNALDRNGDVIK